MIYRRVAIGCVLCFIHCGPVRLDNYQFFQRFQLLYLVLFSANSFSQSVNGMRLHYGNGSRGPVECSAPS